ncbi:chemotaxis protein CheW [Halobacteria archaeon AArc-dxtr1]|nr:chemotaxis protein CheW [Halobacteria archaeon AArc-dxtr1]
MTANDSDPDDEFEDQLSDVGGRAREKLSESDRKKAEKLGVSPTASADDDQTDESADPEPDGDQSAEHGQQRSPEEQSGGTHSDVGTTEDGADGSGNSDNQPVNSEPTSAMPPAESTSGQTDESMSGQTGESTSGQTDQSTPSTGAGTERNPADESDGAGSPAEKQYEFQSMTATPSQSGNRGGSSEATGTVEGAFTGGASTERGERMAVTKNESSFVIGDNDVAADVEERKLLYFELNDELFAGSIESVSSVEELPGLTRYPRSPQPIDGVTDMRGKIIAVLNPKVIVNLSDSGASAPREGGEYIIVQNEREDEHRLGIRVDDISHVETVTDEDITSIHDISEMDLLTIDENYLEGIVHGYRADDEMTVPLVDFDSLTESLKEYS